MKDDHPTSESTPTTRAMNWRLFFLLWTASVIGIILVRPYGLAMIPAFVYSSGRLPAFSTNTIVLCYLVTC